MCLLAPSLVLKHGLAVQSNRPALQHQALSHVLEHVAFCCMTCVPEQFQLDVQVAQRCRAFTSKQLTKGTVMQITGLVQQPGDANRAKLCLLQALSLCPIVTIHTLLAGCKLVIVEKRC